jgi:NADPH-dependent curcumin reductase CurA
MWPMPQVNKRVLLAARPAGFPRESDFRIVEEPAPDPGDGQVLIRILYLSVDPYMRGRMSDAPSYAAPVQIGEVMTGGAVGRVIASRNPRFAEGDIVEGVLGWQEYALSDGRGLRKIDPSVATITTALGVLGMPGLTAYFGVVDICRPKAGETMVVSGAAGAVGSIAGQIGKILGARVVGAAGSDDKIAWITVELGFDAGFNYKRESNYRATLKELCPQGIDSYFDNVGGALTDAVISLINVHARVAICGQISQYNLERPEMGPRWLGQLIVKRALVRGFLILDYASRFGEGLKQMAQWLKEGKLKYREQFTEGIESAPRAFLGMLRGENTGKQLVRVAVE